MTIIQQPLRIGQFSDVFRVSCLQIGQNAPDMFLEDTMKRTNAAVMAACYQRLIVRLGQGRSHMLE